MANKANNTVELRPAMTKAKALQLIIEHVSERGIPEKDIIVHTEGDANNINQWTYQGLCKLLIDEL